MTPFSRLHLKIMRRPPAESDAHACIADRELV